MAKTGKAAHRATTKKVKAEIETALGSYAEGGPAVVIARPEWDGLTKKVELATDEELGEITSVVLHVH